MYENNVINNVYHQNAKQKYLVMLSSGLIFI